MRRLPAPALPARTRPARTLGVLALGAALIALAGPATTAAAAPAPSARYIVTARSAGAVDTGVARLRASHAPIGRHYSHVFHGFSASLTTAQVARLRSDPGIEAVRPVTTVHSTVSTTSVGEETGATWGLDRIDQRTGTDGRYFYNTTGAGVTAYVIDTGIRMDQTDFQGRATSGWDFADGDSDASDCPSNYQDDPANDKISHGTHVAGTIGGKTWGVAKRVNIVSVRVLDCDGSGTSDDVIAGLDWVVAHHPSTPSVVNLSLGGDQSSDLDAAVQATIDAGIPVVVAAGNEGQNACHDSPADVRDAITVGASDRRDNQAWQFTNWGPCVDLFAPGVDIRSAGTRTNHSSLVLSGTSMATPHVTGAVARYLQAHPSATPAQVSSAIDQAASHVGIGDADGSPDRLLYAYSEKTPSAPTRVSAIHSDRSRTATVRWSVPTSNGGESMTGYQAIRAGKDAAGHTGAVVNLSARARSYTFKGLVAGTTYTLTVKARNAVGLSLGASAKTTITAKPGRAKLSSVTAGSTHDHTASIGVTWHKPSSGGAVKHYVITATRSGSHAVKSVTVSSRSRSARLTGLQRNHAYVIRIRAVNDSGSGPTVRWAHSVTAR